MSREKEKVELMSNEQQEIVSIDEFAKQEEQGCDEIFEELEARVHALERELVVEQHSDKELEAKVKQLEIKVKLLEDGARKAFETTDANFVLNEDRHKQLEVKITKLENVVEELLLELNRTTREAFRKVDAAFVWVNNRVKAIEVDLRR